MAGLDKFLYNFARRYATPMIKYTGVTTVVGSETVYVYQRDSLGKILLAVGTTPPTDATAGYAKGAKFVDTNESAGTGPIYVNIGTSTSCAFVRQRIVPFVPANASITACNTNTTLTAATCAGLNVTNTGAGGSILLTLPAVATMLGKAFRVQVTVAQIVQASLSGVKVYLGGNGVASKYLQIAGVIGNYAEIFCDGTDYHVVGYSGVLTKEA